MCRRNQMHEPFNKRCAVLSIGTLDELHDKGQFVFVKTFAFFETKQDHTYYINSSFTFHHSRTFLLFYRILNQTLNVLDRILIPFLRNRPDREDQKQGLSSILSNIFIDVHEFEIRWTYSTEFYLILHEIQATKQQIGIH